MQAMAQLQQDFNALQAQMQEQATGHQGPITSLHAAMETLATSHLEQQQMQQNFQTSIQHILGRLAQRTPTVQRHPIPQPLSPKFKANNDELSFSDFKAKLHTVASRFPDSLSTDVERIQYALQVFRPLCQQ
jgi:hypothetical protein